jgi:hypothetical protein
MVYFSEELANFGYVVDFFSHAKFKLILKIFELVSRRNKNTLFATGKGVAVIPPVQ